MARASDIREKQSKPPRPRKLPHQTFDYRLAKQQAKSTSISAYDAALKFLSDEPNINFKKVSLKLAIYNVTVAFWKDKAFDDLAKKGHIKKRIKELGYSIYKMCGRLEDVEDVLQYYKKQ